MPLSEEVPINVEAAYDAITKGPLAKLDRAQKHIVDLNGQMAEFLQATPFELRVRQTQDPPWRVIYVEAKHTIPEYFPLILGDAVHNLRTALDHLCFGMVGDKTKSPGQVGFPFPKSGSDGLVSAIATRQMHLAPKEVIREIHALQPYAGGNRYLTAVKVLDERDKHHFILTVGVSANFTARQLGSLVGQDLVAHLPPELQIAAVGNFGVSLQPHEATEVFDKKADPQPPLTIGFAEGEELANLPLIPSLAKMVSATHDAIWKLGSAWAAATAS